MTEGNSDVLILGGGVIGLGCALGLLRAGRSVTVLEGGTVGSGSSRGNCGTITPSHLPLHAPGTIGRAARYGNLTLATGHGMLGMSLSAITAQRVTDPFGGRTARLDMAPLSPRRFGA